MFVRMLIDLQIMNNTYLLSCIERSKVFIFVVYLLIHTLFHVNQFNGFDYYTSHQLYYAVSSIKCHLLFALLKLILRFGWTVFERLRRMVITHSWLRMSTMCVHNLCSFMNVYTFCVIFYSYLFFTKTTRQGLFECVLLHLMAK